MSSNQATTHPGRKRRAHKRSRNGCLTCKQRHIRCNELKPVCTNCLTRGGECGYAEAVTRPARGSTPASSFITTTTTRHGQQQAEQQSRLRLSGPLVSSPADPFDSLLMKMPLRSLELFHQFVNYRIFSRAKNPNSQCAGIALSNPGTFRACLIMTALHRSWLSNTTNAVATNYTDMEETYLYHKLEAMRLVNEQIADPNLCTSDGCLSLIAGLALAESGMGDCVAAEAHLNGLFILIDMKRPEEWQHRFYGMLQRIILMAGSFIAASKTPATLPSDNSDYDCPLLPDYTKPPSPLFSTALFATRLSPFYRFSTPCMEACKADVEGEVLINALRRLTSICFSSSSSLHCSSPSPSSSNTTNNPPPATAPADARITSILLSDTEAYIASLLFKPDPFDTSALSPSSPASDPLRLSSSRKKKKTCSRIREQPYQTLPAEFFPCSSRAWATAAYLYLHVVLVQLWEGQHPQTSSPPATTEMETAKKKPHKIDPHLLRFLLDTLKEDAMATEEAMRVGAYSSELWIWKALLGAYVTHITEQDGVYTQPIPRDCGEKIGKNSSSSTPRTSLARSESCGSVGSEDSDHFFSFFGGFGDDNDNENDDSEENEDADDDDENEEEKAQDERRMQRSKSVEETNYLDSMRSWFRSKLTTWSRVSKVTEWSVVRQMLGRIVWVSEDNVSDGESVMEGLWWDVVHRPPHEFEGDYMRAEILRRGSPLVAVTLPVDPALK